MSYEYKKRKEKKLKEGPCLHLAVRGIARQAVAAQVEFESNR